MMPTNRMPTINSEVATGCRMNGSEMPPAMFRAPYRARSALRSAPARPKRRRGRLDQRALDQSVLARRDHCFAGGQTRQDDRLAVAFLSDRDGAHLDLVVAADDEGVEAVRPALDGAVGYDGDLLQRVDQQAGRDREAGPQGAVRILERRLHADGAARRVDRVVDDGEMALRKRPQPVRTQGGYRRDAGRQRLVDLRHVLLRRREHDRDRLQLNDGHDARRVGGMHDVAGVDQAKARLTRERRADCRVVDLRLRVVDRSPGRP